MSLGTKVRLGPGHILLDRDPAPPKGAQPQFPLMSFVAERSPISATVEHLLPIQHRWIDFDDQYIIRRVSVEGGAFWGCDLWAVMRVLPYPHKHFWGLNRHFQPNSQNITRTHQEMR